MTEAINPKQAYEWLKKQDHSAPDFAAKSGVLAALSRQLQVSLPERLEAEENGETV